MALKAHFFPKIFKNRLVAGGSVPRPPSLMRLSYTSLHNASTKLDISTF